MEPWTGPKLQEQFIDLKNVKAIQYCLLIVLMKMTIKTIMAILNWKGRNDVIISG